MKLYHATIKIMARGSVSTELIEEDLAVWPFPESKKIGKITQLDRWFINKDEAMLFLARGIF